MSRNVVVTCDNQDCHAPATKTCSRCRIAYYCSQECQASNYSRHKIKCREMSRTERQATNEARPIDASQAEALVAAVSRQLNGPDPATVAALPVADTPLAQLKMLAKQSTENERQLGKAGACQVLASALEARLDGDGPSSLDTLHEICVGTIHLMATCVKNGVTLGQLGVISHATRALRLATREGDWRFVETTLILLKLLAVRKDPSHCERFGAAGTFEAVAECVVTNASCPDDAFPAAFAGFEACSTLYELQLMAAACADPWCQNARKLARVVGLPAALDRWLERALAHAALEAHGSALGLDTQASGLGFPDRSASGDTNNAIPGTSIRGPSSYAIRNSTQDMTFVAQCFKALILRRQPGVLPDAGVRALATPRVCQNLVRTLALAGTPASLVPQTTPIINEWLLLGDVTLVILSVCEGFKRDIPAALAPAADVMVRILKDANRAGARSAQSDMVMGVGSMASQDTQVAARVVEAGGCEDVVEAMRQAMGRHDTACVGLAHDSIQRLVQVPNGARRLATSGAATCEVLVRALRFGLNVVANQGPRADFCAELLPCWVLTWLKMMRADERCKQHFVAANGEQALSLALGVPVVANDRAAVMLYRGTRDEMLSRPTSGP
eukprot:jgi/Mesvir1/6991/Mv09129-RA.1